MAKKSTPKFERDIKDFLGIKSGIILEGNVYDDYPRFNFAGEEPEYIDTDNLNMTLLSLIDTSKSDAIFFDPVEGFFCYEGTKDTQREKLMKLLEGYDVIESFKEHDTILCLMPAAKKGSRQSDGSETYIYEWASEIIRKAMSNRTECASEKHIVFIVNFASRLDDCNNRGAEANKMFMNLMKATNEAYYSETKCNTLIMVVDKYNDIPAWLFLNNPGVKTINICLPDRDTRRTYLKNLYGALERYKVLGDDDYEPGIKFVSETEDLKLLEIKQILQLAYLKEIAPEDIDLAFEMYKYGTNENLWENLDDNVLERFDEIIKSRVLGQGEALEKIKNVVRQAVLGLTDIGKSGSSHTPRGTLFFAGSTGVGKTEAAKAIAYILFGDEKAMIRFDMSEYREAHSEAKLIGSPPGYVGYEVGGQLTNAVKNRPFSVLLFDELDKASPTIMDKFLQILEDGRLTDNQGNTVYFEQTLIIFTSNIGTTEEVPGQFNGLGATPHRVPTITIEDPSKEDDEAFRQHVSDTIRDHVVSYFVDNGRPELLNRLGRNNIIVFQFINVKDAIAICDSKLKMIHDEFLKKYKDDICFDDVREMLHEKAIAVRENGGRGIVNMLDEEVKSAYGAFKEKNGKGHRKLRCVNGQNGIEFEVVENET